MTLKEAAYQAGIHENTARFYRDKYEEFFPSVGEGRNRKYALATVDLLKFIKSCYDAKLDADQVRDRLGQEFGIPVVVNTMTLKTPQQEIAAIVVEQLQNIIAQALAQQAAAYQDEIKSLRNEIVQLQQQLNTIDRSRENRDKEIMENIRQLQAAAQSQSRPWWKFWGK